MYMFLLKNLKRNKFLLLFLLIGCSRKDPIAKVNSEFLQQYRYDISKQQKKHKVIAKENGILYFDEKEVKKEASDSFDPTDDDVYSVNKKIVNKDLYTFKGKTGKGKSNDNTEGFFDNNIPEEIRLYKDIDGNYLDANGNKIQTSQNAEIYYVKDDSNKEYFKQRGVDFSDIALQDEALYGELNERKKKNYKTMNYDVVQINYDYIDTADRIKKEIFVENKKRGKKDTKEAPGLQKDTIKDKFINLFK